MHLTFIIHQQIPVKITAESENSHEKTIQSDPDNVWMEEYL